MIVPKENAAWRGGDSQMNSAQSLYDRSLNFANVKATGHHRWDEINARVGLPPMGRKHQPCPMCGGKDRFRRDDKTGHGDWICNQCGAGDGFALIERALGLSSTEVLHLVARALGMTGGVTSEHLPTIRQSKPEVVPSDAIKRRLNRIWSQTVPLSEVPAVIQYFAKRGLILRDDILDLRAHRSLTYWRVGEDGLPKPHSDFPALVALIRSPEGKAHGLQLKYLSEEGDKAPVDDNRKIRSLFAGATAYGAIRLAEPVGTLAITEGLETALAVSQSTTDLPVWSCLSAGGIERIVVPSTVKEVYIFADNDLNGRGQAAAAKAADRLTASGVTVKVLIPPVSGADWLDILKESKDENQHLGNNC